VANVFTTHETLRIMVRWSLVPVVGMSWMALHCGVWITLALVILLVSLMGMGIVFSMRHLRFSRRV
jgi:flagellar biosynthesis protein FlhB